MSEAVPTCELGIEARMATSNEETRPMPSVDRAVASLNRIADNNKPTYLVLYGSGLAPNQRVDVKLSDTVKWTGKLTQSTADMVGIAKLRRMEMITDEDKKKPRESQDVTVTVDGGDPKTITIDVYSD
jgi:hypothetical protein